MPSVAAQAPEALSLPLTLLADGCSAKASSCSAAASLCLPLPTLTPSRLEVNPHRSTLYSPLGPSPRTPVLQYPYPPWFCCTPPHPGVLQYSYPPWFCCTPPHPGVLQYSYPPWFCCTPPHPGSAVPLPTLVLQYAYPPWFCSTPTNPGSAVPLPTLPGCRPAVPSQGASARCTTLPAAGTAGMTAVRAVHCRERYTLLQKLRPAPRGTHILHQRGAQPESRDGV